VPAGNVPGIGTSVTIGARGLAMTGASFTAVTVIETVATFESAVPSLAL